MSMRSWVVLATGLVLSAPGGVAAQVPAKRQAQVATSKGSFATLSKQADEAREAEHLEEAVVKYKRALALKPSWNEGWWSLGTSLYELDRYAEARDAFRRLARLTPSNGAALTFKGLCEFQLKNYERALVDLQQGRQLGLAKNQSLAQVASYHTAILLNRFSQFERASELLRPFAIAGNDTVSVIEAFGIALLRLPQLPSELAPERREVVMLAGRAAFHTAARRVAPAEAAYKELVLRFPTLANVHYAYGTFLLGSDTDRGIAELKRELEISPTHTYAMLQIAMEYLRRSDPQAAKPLAERAVELTPDAFEAQLALGQVLLDLTETERAIQALETAARLAPDSPRVRFMLGRAYSRAGRSEDAERERAEFLRLDRLVRSSQSGQPAVGGIPPGDSGSEAPGSAPPR